jgi:hypothetical protein
MADRTSDNPAGARKAASASKEPAGPTPMHHRLRLGQTDGVTNPQGAGQPSRQIKIANDERKTY